MSAFCICNPHILPEDPHKIEFVLDYRESIALGKGTKEFITKILQDIGICVNVMDWELHPFRSKYYSELPDSDDWKDSWILNWKITVETTEIIEDLPFKDPPLIGTDAFDPTWVETKRPDENSTLTCLVISDFDTEEQVEEVQDRIVSTFTSGKFHRIQQKYLVDRPTFSCFTVLGRYKQLQIDLGKFPDTFFAQGADYAERILELCKEKSGTLNFEDRL